MLGKLFSKNQPLVEMKFSPGRGRGVFATRDIKQVEIIETSPVLVIPVEEIELIYKTNLYQYHYDWIIDGKTGGAVGLGLLSLYNHSASPNATFFKHYNNNTISIVACSNIKKGEEIFINYREDYLIPPEKLWFE
jgi:SET domain-containing protein